MKLQIFILTLTGLMMISNNQKASSSKLLSKPTLSEAPLCPYGTTLFYFTANINNPSFRSLTIPSNYRAASGNTNDSACEGIETICAICAVAGNSWDIPEHQYPIFDPVTLYSPYLQLHTLNLLMYLEYYVDTRDKYTDDSIEGLIYEKDKP